MQYIIKNKSMNNYTQVYNEIIHNCKHNLDVLGFAVVLLSKPPDWVINVYGLMNELKIGKERVLKLLSALEKNGYIYKKTNVQFAKKGEQKTFYYMFDCKEILLSTFTENGSKGDSQLPLITPPALVSPDTVIPGMVIPDVVIPDVVIPDVVIPDVVIPDVVIPDVDSPELEDKTYTNKEITNTISYQENKDKKNTKLTLREVLDKLVDEKTKINILNANPNLTLEEFQHIYKKVQLEHKKNYCKDINAVLVLAISGRWKFRTKLSDENSEMSDGEKTRKVVASNYDYYLSYFEEIGRTNSKEIHQKFLKDCTKYDSSIVDIYSEKLKKELGIF